MDKGQLNCILHVEANSLAIHQFVCFVLFQVENVITVLNKTFPDDGLLPIYINPDSGTTSYSPITFGAMGDRY